MKLKLQRDTFAVIFVTIYLITYCAFLQYESMERYGLIMFIFAPFLLVWMVYSVLKFGKYKGPALGNDEFGYLDKNKDEL